MASPSPDAPRILIVEDDPGNALVMKTILVRLGGMRVEISEDGDYVLGLVRDGGVDLVVMDVSLTNTCVAGKSVDGLELTRQIKSERPTRVLLATAHAMRGDREKFLADSGADGYVAKPIIDHQGFVSAVTSLLGR
jgi:CheY-like chemotaxis protein